MCAGRAQKGEKLESFGCKSYRIDCGAESGGENGKTHQQGTGIADQEKVGRSIPSCRGRGRGTNNNGARGGGGGVGIVGTGRGE